MDDFIDLRPEWGTATVSSDASAGALTLAVSGLGSGTLRSGTTFTLDHNGNFQTYTLLTDTVPSAGAAVLPIAPPLVAPVSAGVAVTPESRKKSLYNKRTGRLFFSDADLQYHAQHAMKVKGRWIRQSENSDVALFRAVRFFGWTAMLSSDEYLAAILMNDERGTAAKLIDAKKKLLDEDEGIVFAEEAGASIVYLSK